MFLFLLGFMFGLAGIPVVMGIVVESLLMYDRIGERLRRRQGDDAHTATAKKPA